MTYLNITKWGGRVGRYSIFKGQTLRAHDPFGHKPVQFAREQHYEAWLRVRFRPDTHSMCNMPIEVHAPAKQGLSARATFTSTSRTGQESYYAVHRGRESRAIDQLRKVAFETGAIVECISEEALRCDQAHFWRLEFLRQVAAIYESDGEDFDLPIIQAVRQGCATQDSLHRQFSAVSDQLIDARLAHLHCQGRLRLDLTTENFDVTEGGQRP